MDLLSLGASLASQIQKAIHAELACETTPGLFNLTHSPIPQHVNTSTCTASEPRCVCRRSESAVTIKRVGSIIAGSTLKFSHAGCTAQLMMHAQFRRSLENVRLFMVYKYFAMAFAYVTMQPLQNYTSRKPDSHFCKRRKGLVNCMCIQAMSHCIVQSGPTLPATAGIVKILLREHA